MNNVSNYIPDSQKLYEMSNEQIGSMHKQIKDQFDNKLDLNDMTK